MKMLKPAFAVLAMVLLTVAAFAQLPPERAKIETAYDKVKDKTSVRMAPFKVSGDHDKYHSIHIAPSFSYEGKQPPIPSRIDFEVQTVVKGKLHKDLYVVFIVDGETIFLSSSRWGINRPVPGRSWMGERLVFHMPYETLLKIAAAKAVEIKLDAVEFEFDEPHKQAIRDFAHHIQSIAQ